MNINTGLVILLLIIVFSLAYIENDRANQLKEWQANWEVNGELPLDRVQNKRLDRLEKQVFGSIQPIPKEH